MNIESVSAGLAEPAIFASLASGGDAATPLVKPVLDLIGRQRAGTQATFVKPTNHSNRLIPQILQARPGTRAILMSNPIEAFLASVASKGMHGRRWGRNLFLEMQGYAGMDFGMDNRELFVMSDLQAAALAWFLNQNFFAALLEGPGGEHLRVLEGDVFNRQRTETLAATLRFAGIDCASDVAETAAQSPVFTKHSKLGGSVSDGERSERIDPDANVLQEIGQVAQWVGLIADQVDRSIPIAQTLFDPE